MKGRQIFGVNLVAETIKFVPFLYCPLSSSVYVIFSLILDRNGLVNRVSFLLFLFNRASKSIRVLELVVGNISVKCFIFHMHFIISLSSALNHLL